MLAVLVDFKVKEGKETQFHIAIGMHAQNSLRNEEGCLLFEVCVNPDNPNECFLYELYQGTQAFDLHLTSDHFANFEQLAGSWIETKNVRTFNKIEN